MGKKNKEKLELNKDKIKKKRKFPYIIGLIVVFIIIFFGINHYLSQNYVYNIPFTNLNINGNNPIMNADSENVGNVYYIENNKLKEVNSSERLETLKNSITANCTREYISFSTGYPRLVRNYIVYPETTNSNGNNNSSITSPSSSVIYSIEGSANNNSFKGNVQSVNYSSTGEGEIEYTISQKAQEDPYINVYISNNDVNLEPSSTKDTNASFTMDLSEGSHNIDYDFGNINNAEKILNGVFNYVLYGNINN